MGLIRQNVTEQNVLIELGICNIAQIIIRSFYSSVCTCQFFFCLLKVSNHRTNSYTFSTRLYTIMIEFTHNVGIQSIHI